MDDKPDDFIEKALKLKEERLAQQMQEFWRPKINLASKVGGRLSIAN